MFFLKHYLKGNPPRLFTNKSSDDFFRYSHSRKHLWMTTCGGTLFVYKTSFGSLPLSLFYIKFHFLLTFIWYVLFLLYGPVTVVLTREKQMHCTNQRLRIIYTNKTSLIEALILFEIEMLTFFHRNVWDKQISIFANYNWSIWPKEWGSLNAEKYFTI